MSSSIKYVCPKTGKTKEKYFSDGITTIKKEHFVELLNHRANKEKFQTEIGWLKQQLWERLDLINALTAERDSAVASLDQERKTVKSIKSELGELATARDYHQKVSESHTTALANERKKNVQFVKGINQLTSDYQKLKASLEDVKREGLEREKQLLNERKEHDSIVSDLLKNVEAQEKQNLPKPTESLRPKLSNLEDFLKPIEAQKKQHLPKPTESLRPKFDSEDKSKTAYMRPENKLSDYQPNSAYSPMNDRRSDLNARIDNRSNEMNSMLSEVNGYRKAKNVQPLENSWEQGLHKALLEAQYEDFLKSFEKNSRRWDDDFTR